MTPRQNVSDNKSSILEEIENLVDEPLTDGAWNALAKISQADLFALQGWLIVALKKFSLKE